MRGALLLLGGACLAHSAGATTWTDAKEARKEMERMVKRHAYQLQQNYKNIANTTSALCSSDDFTNNQEMDAFDMCDRLPAKWKMAKSYPQYLNPDTKSCVALDLDAQGFILGSPVTGRTTAAGGTEKCAPALKFSDASTTQDQDDPNEDCKCRQWATVEDNAFQPECITSESKHDNLNDEGCTDEGNLGICKVDKHVYGYSFIQGQTSSYSITSPRVVNEMCATNDVNRLIREDMNNHPQIGAHFLGMQDSGLYRTWPALYQCRTEAQCSGCSDPRYRGWYASAASGPKDVVIVIDKSGSMEQSTGTGTRMQHAIVAAKWVINTFTEDDFAQVVAFSSEAKSADGDGTELLSMNPINRKLLKGFLNAQKADGGTNFIAGFTKAFEIMHNSETNGLHSSGCTQAIIFLTDGEGDDPRSTINSFNGGPYQGKTNDYAKPFTRIFTYTFGAGAKGLMSNIACENGGIYHQISDAQAPMLKEVMANYFVYLAAGLVPSDLASDVSTRWVDIFEDGQGRGQETAVCAPVYNYDLNLASPQLFGVLCLGIFLPTAKKLNGWDAEWAAIRSEQRKCKPSKLVWDQMQILRGLPQGGRKFTSSCPATAGVAATGRTKGAWTTAELEDMSCANMGLSTGWYVLIVLVGLTVVGCVGSCVMKTMNSKRQKSSLGVQP